MFVEIRSTVRGSRLLTKASHKIKRKRITATREMVEPIEDTVFHSV